MRRPRWWRKPWRFPRMAEILPEARRGSVVIRHFTVDRDEAEEKTLMRQELWLPGTYASLEIAGTGWMYDIPDEWLKNAVAVEQATGDVLVVGLGLGMILHPILAKPDVRTVTVIEKSRAVAELVLPSLAAVPGREKLELVLADARRWRPKASQRYDAIWLDALPCYSFQKWWVEQAWEWMQLYGPYLREPRSAIGHWALDEVLQEWIDRDDGKPTQRRRTVERALTAMLGHPPRVRSITAADPRSPL